MLRSSEPVQALEAPVEESADGDDDGEHRGIAEAAVEFGHVVEVHAVNAGDGLGRASIAAQAASCRVIASARHAVRPAQVSVAASASE